MSCTSPCVMLCLVFYHVRCVLYLTICGIVSCTSPCEMLCIVCHHMLCLFTFMFIFVLPSSKYMSSFLSFPYLNLIFPSLISTYLPYSVSKSLSQSFISPSIALLFIYFFLNWKHLTLNTQIRLFVDIQP